MLCELICSGRMCVMLCCVKNLVMLIDISVMNDGLFCNSVSVVNVEVVLSRCGGKWMLVLRNLCFRSSCIGMFV